MLMFNRFRSEFAVFTYKKIAFTLAIFFIVLSFLFLVTRLMPSSPASIMASKLNIQGGITSISGGSSGGGGATAKVEIMKKIYIEKFGLTKPMPEKYILFMKRFVTLDFGVSYYRYPASVSQLISHSLPWTMILVIPSIPIGFVIGNWIGSYTAMYKGKWSSTLYYFMMYLSRAPFFWIALILAFIFSTVLGWFPSMGPYSPAWMGPQLSFDWFMDAAHHWVLPFLSVIGLGIGGWAISMRAMVVYEKESDYMEYVKQLGFSKGARRQIAEKNAILPNFTKLPLTVKKIIGMTLILEVVFSYPGIGNLMYKAAFNADYPLLEATFGITIVVVLVGNFMIDVLYGIIDPRIGTGYIEGE